MTPVRLEPMIPRSRVKHSTTEPLRSLNFILGRYIVGWKFNFTATHERSQRYNSPNEIFEYGYPHSNALLQFNHQLEHCKQHKATRHPTKCDIINDVKLFLTVYRRKYCLKFLMFSNLNQASCYKSKCIRICIRICIHQLPLIFIA